MKQAILENLDIKAFYDDLLPSLRWYPQSGMALCPFHEDHNPSLSINPERGTFHCFGCGESGSLFDFYMRYYGTDYKTALQELAIRAGIETNKGKESLQNSKIEATYNYTDESGNLLFQVVRFNPKGFRQRRPDGNGGWI